MTTKPRTLSSDQARRFFPTLVNEAFYQKKTVIITKHDRPYAAIVPLSEEMINSLDSERDLYDEDM